MFFKTFILGDHQWNIDEPVQENGANNYHDKRGCDPAYADNPTRNGKYPGEKNWWDSDPHSFSFAEEDMTVVSNHFGNECYTRPELCEEEGFTIAFNINGKFTQKIALIQ